MITVSGIIIAIEEKDVFPEYPDEPSDFIHSIQDEGRKIEDISLAKIIAHQELGKVGDSITVRVIQTEHNRLIALT